MCCNKIQRDICCAKIFTNVCKLQGIFRENSKSLTNPGYFFNEKFLFSISVQQTELQLQLWVCFILATNVCRMCCIFKSLTVTYSYRNSFSHIWAKFAYSLGGGNVPVGESIPSLEITYASYISLLLIYNWFERLLSSNARNCRVRDDAECTNN